MKVRILANSRLVSIALTPFSGSYDVSIDNKPVLNKNSNGLFQVLLQHDSIVLKNHGKVLGTGLTVRFSGTSIDDILKIKSTLPDLRARFYNNDIELSVIVKGEIRMINTIQIENYIAGVVEAEAGGKTTLEYYKLQSILCRTYALSHKRRHEPEGFEVCDLVHCQAYKGRTRNELINKAVSATKGMVIVDDDLKLITAAFHSNCGGQTLNSEDVWSLSLPYLKSVKDTFCLHMPHAQWQRKIATEDWMLYLNLRHKYATEDSLINKSALNYGPNAREVCFIKDNVNLPLKTIRSDWSLRSTYFSIEQQNDSISFKGRGFGHGIGLCQEGAMHMTQLGFSYQDIIHFYYKNVHLVNMEQLDFFRENEFDKN